MEVNLFAHQESYLGTPSSAYEIFVGREYISIREPGISITDGQIFLHFFYFLLNDVAHQETLSYQSMLVWYMGEYVVSIITINNGIE